MKFSTILSTAIFSILCSLPLTAQYVPVPAPAQTQPVVIMGAMAHLGNGQVIENSVVAFEQGKFTVVDNIAIKRGFPNHKQIDGTGMQLYPGFIAPNTTLGLQEIGAVRATRDSRELGQFNPNIRSIIAYDTDSEITPTVRSMGVLMAEVVPQGGRISGSSSLVQLDAWNWEDAAYATDFSIHMNWPSSSSYNWRTHQMTHNEDFDDQLRELENYFTQAQAYHQNPHPERVNLRFEAMKGLFDGSKRLFIHAGNVKSIQEAVLFAGKFQITPTIVGGSDAWMITGFLKKHGVAIILDSTQRLPSRTDEDIDQPFKTPAILHDAGLLYCQGHEGFWQIRNLAFQAGQAVPFGLPYEAAVQSLTLDAAKIMGIDKTCGSVEVGKDATFFLCAGDALDPRSSKVTRAFIQGREISLDNKQEMLYRRFQQKYKGK
ncbi:MAG: amidohydrolase family protein [Saprospiraceae bacterium]